MSSKLQGHEEDHGREKFTAGVKYEYRAVTQRGEAMGLTCILVFTAAICVLNFLELRAKRSVIYHMLV